ncbi:MAG: hypothetical protein E6I50_01035, partial [Chloroflexi bacterium]
MKRRAAIAVILIALSACASASPASPQQAARQLIPKPPPTLATAVAHAARLGPAGESTSVALSFGLKVRHPDQLAAILASGQTVSPADYAARFGPDETLVGRAVTALSVAGFHAAWQPPSGVIAADGPAPAAAALLHVDIESYRLANGTTFYASLDEPQLPPVLAAVATGVSGLDDYRRTRGYAVRPGGVEPVDVLSYYNLKPLRDAGLDGAGQTVLLPEIDDVAVSDLETFATKFGLPPFAPLLTIKRDANWGTPEKAQGETALDLEIIHEVAPAAKLVVYMSAADFGHGDRAFDQLVTDHLGSIISES